LVLQAFFVKRDALQKPRNFINPLIIIFLCHGLSLSTAYLRPGALLRRCLARSVKDIPSFRTAREGGKHPLFKRGFNKPYDLFT